jgi:hypothetical protein
VKALAAVGSNKLLIIVLFIYIIHIATRLLHKDKVGREVPLFPSTTAPFCGSKLTLPSSSRNMLTACPPSGFVPKTTPTATGLRAAWSPGSPAKLVIALCAEVVWLSPSHLLALRAALLPGSLSELG